MKGVRGMTHVTIPFSKWASIGGAILVAWQLAGKADTALVQHLDQTFATKADFQRLEEKLDRALMQHVPETPRKK